MIEQELRVILNSFLMGNIRTVEDAVRAIKEAGYLSHEEVQGLIDMAMMRARLGYVQLAENQNLPTIPRGSYSNADYLRGQSDMLKAGWRKVLIT